MTDDPDTFDLDSARARQNCPETRRDRTATDADAPASLAKLFPSLQRKVDRFYEIQTGDEVTASVFRAESDSWL